MEIPGFGSDQAAFEGVYQAFHGRVLALCRRLLADAAAAEDAAADVFAQLPDAVRSYDPARPFESWLLSVAANRCIDRLRRARKARQIFADDPEADPAGRSDPLATLLRREARDRVSRAVDGLPEKYRVPLVLRFHVEQSYAEIADALDIEVGQVASLLFRARKRLRETLAGARAS